MWTYNNTELKQEDIPEYAIGFIYRITYIPDDTWYIGRKNLKKTSYKTIKGKKKKVLVDSDWMIYNSSSDQLKDMLKEYEEDKFKKEILLFTESASQTLYAEECLLYRTNAILDDKCLNNNIRAKVYRKWFSTEKNDKFKNDIRDIKL
jgi:hypothetical protein